NVNGGLKGNQMNKAGHLITQLQEQQRALVDSILDKPMQDIAGKPRMRDTLNQEQINSLYEGVAARTRILVDAFTNQDTGLFQRVTQVLQNTRDSNKLKLLSSDGFFSMIDVMSPEMRSIAWISLTPGQQDRVSGKIQGMSNGSTSVNDTADLISGSYLLESTDAGRRAYKKKTGGRIPSLVEMAAQKDNPEYDPTSLPATITFGLEKLKNPAVLAQMKPHEVNRYISRFYGTEALQLFDDSVPGNVAPKDREKLFNMLVNPAMTNFFLKQKESGNTGAWEIYNAFAFHRFQVDSISDMSTINDIVSSNGTMNVSLNPITMKFELKSTGKEQKSGLSKTWRATNNYNAQRAVDRVNNRLEQMKTMLQANEADPNVTMPQIIAQLGFQAVQEHKMSMPDLIDWLGEAADSGIKSAAKATAGALDKGISSVTKPSGEALSRAGEAAMSTAEQVKSWINDAISKGGDALDAMLNGASDAFIEGGKTVGGAINAAEEKVKAQAKEKYNESAQALHDMKKDVQAAGSAVEQGATVAIETAGKGARAVGEAAGAAAEAAGGTIQKGVNAAGEVVNAVIDKAGNLVDEYGNPVSRFKETFESKTRPLGGTPMKRNNPGNIKASENTLKYQGISGTDGEYVTFATPEAG
ncbi:MAG: hypothetical protein ACWGQW_13780, partial [bacterium]